MAKTIGGLPVQLTTPALDDKIPVRDVSEVGTNVNKDKYMLLSQFILAGQVFTVENGLLCLRTASATISSGAITATAPLMIIDTESMAANDDLDTINGGVDGALILLRTFTPNRDVVIKHNTGNIVNDGMTDFTLSHPRDFWIAVYNGSSARWCGLGANCFP